MRQSTDWESSIVLMLLNWIYFGKLVISVFLFNYTFCLNKKNNYLAEDLFLFERLTSDRNHFLELSSDHLELFTFFFVTDGNEFQTIVQQCLSLFLLILIFSQMRNVMDCLVWINLFKLRKFFDIVFCNFLILIGTQGFFSYWAETGVPSFLVCLHCC